MLIKSTAMNNNTISITGCGWLGLPLAKRLLTEGYTVKGSTTSIDKLDVLSQVGIEAHLVDYRNNIFPAEFFECDVLVIIIPPGRDGKTTYAKGIKSLIEQIDPTKTKVIFTSSTGVYKDNNGAVNESSPLSPSPRSGTSIIDAEAEIQNQKAPYVILRLAGLVGANRNMGNFLAGRQNVPNGKAPVNLVHQEDCIRSIVTMIECNEWNNVFNICADLHPEKQIIYPHQSQTLGKVPPTFIDELTSYKVVNNSKFKDQYNFSYNFPDPMSFN